MTFSYNPAKANDNGLNQMRFFLGDCLVTEAEKTAYLSDEEILVTLEQNTFKRAALKLVESLLHRFMFEVTTEIREAKWQLSDRVDFWEKLRKRLKDEIDAEDAAQAFGFMAGKSRPPAFWLKQFDWRP